MGNREWGMAGGGLAGWDLLAAGGLAVISIYWQQVGARISIYWHQQQQQHPAVRGNGESGMAGIGARKERRRRVGRRAQGERVRLGGGVGKRALGVREGRCWCSRLRVVAGKEGAGRPDFYPLPCLSHGARPSEGGRSFPSEPCGAEPWWPRRCRAGFIAPSPYRDLTHVLCRKSLWDGRRGARF